jgi:hypothetical protein
MLLSRHQNVGQNRDKKIANRSFGNVSQIRYFGTTVTNQNLFQEINNSRSSRLLPKNVIIRIYKNDILGVVLYGCETWSIILREEHRLRVFENKVLRGIFGSKRDEVTGE